VASTLSNQEYDIPTLKRLNPELYKEMFKQDIGMKDPAFESIQHIRERHGYHEMREQRIQRRMQEMTKELEFKNEENILKTRKKKMNETGRK